MNQEANVLACRKKKLELGKNTLIMGILNVTPDSFSDGGQYREVDAAIAQARRMIAEGADLIDIGGESTRPGSSPVSEEEEQRRVLPVIEALAATVDVPISIDTYKSETARKALEAGADIINDIWGCQDDPKMAHVAAEFDCPIILMHNRKTTEYHSFLEDVKQDLLQSVHIALEAGVKKQNIILDPGFGFAKNVEQNLYLMNHLSEFKQLGYPLLLGTSRKRMIRNVLNVPASQSEEGTAVTTVMGIMQGCDIIRVHDVQHHRRAADMTDAILKRRDGICHG